MNMISFSFWLLFLSIIGLLFRKNLFHILSSLCQLYISLIMFFCLIFNNILQENYVLFVLLILLILIILYGIAMGIALIKKQSSINMNELSEHNG